MTDSPALETDKRVRVAIVGGGLAGLSAAETLARFLTQSSESATAPRPQLDITVLESRRTTGGRAGSFIDPQTGENVDYCQHVAMGCCTNLIDLLDRCGLGDAMARHSQLTFHHPGVPPSPFVPSRWLPAPLHLAPTLKSLAYLSPAQKREIRGGTWKLMRTASADLRSITAQRWLADAGQSADTIDRYWDVVIVSALGEACDRVSMAAARKVFVDGFLAACGASDVLVPRQPLSELFGVRLPEAIKRLNVSVRTGTPVRSLRHSGDGTDDTRLVADLGDRQETFDHVIVAVPWHQVGKIVSPALADAARLDTAAWAAFPTSPISGVHLWFDSPITDAPHAVMVSTMAQWLFRRPDEASRDEASREHDEADSRQASQSRHYYQVVISASRQVRQMSGEEVANRIVEELRAAFPAARTARLLSSRVVTDPQSVFSIRPEVDAARPDSPTALSSLHLAGDFVQTGWPATMEGAVISGRKAANSVLRFLGHRPAEIRDGLPKNWLTRRLIKP